MRAKPYYSFNPVGQHEKHDNAVGTETHIPYSLKRLAAPFWTNGRLVFPRIVRLLTQLDGSLQLFIMEGCSGIGPHHKAHGVVFEALLTESDGHSAQSTRSCTDPLRIVAHHWTAGRHS